MQTFGDLVTFNPHIHALVADGVFYPSGSFRVLPPIPEQALAEALRHQVLDFLCAEAGFDPRLAERMRQWEHSGFSVHNQIRVMASDLEGRKHLARYMIRTPFALEKMTCDKQTGMVLSRSKLHATLKRNFQLLPTAQWLALLLAHIPDKYEHLVRYYSWYSNRARGQRSAAAHTADGHTTLSLDETPPDRRTRAHWARLIQKVYEVDPMECPKCGAAMRVIAVLDDPAIVRCILKHLRLWHPKPKDLDHPARDPPWPPGITIPLTYHPVPDSA